LAEGGLNFLACMGWLPEGEQVIFSLQELEQQFSLERVSKSPAVFDLDKLNHINREHIKLKSEEELAKLIRPYLLRSELKAAVSALDSVRYGYLVHGLRDYLTNLSEAPHYARIFLISPELETAAREVVSTPEAQEVLREIASTLPEDITPEVAKGYLKEFIKQRKLSGKAVYLPLRCALTGQEHGPELPYLLAVVGTNGIKERLLAVI